MFGIFQRSARERKAPAAAGWTPSREVTASLHLEGIVFLHSGKGIVFSSNPVGARIWEGIRGGRTLEEIAVSVGREFAVPVEVAGRDTAQFVRDLQGEGILLSSHEAVL